MTNKLTDEVKEKGGRMTRQRQAVLDIFSEVPGQHLSPEEVSELLRQKGDNISLATIYRTLPMLAEMGFLKKIYLKDGFKYEIRLAEEKHSHHHLICQSCGAVIEIKEGFIDSLHGDALDELENAIEKEHHFFIKDHDLQFFGYCSQCQDKVIK